MKKLLSVVLATLMLFSVIPMALPQTVTAADTVEENTAYLAPQSGNDITAKPTLAGQGNHDPYKTIAAAYNALGAAGGGTLVIEENFTFTSGISFSYAHSGTIVIKGKTSDVAIEYTGTLANQWLKFAGPVVIENITFRTSKTFFLLANHNPFTIGEGVTCDYGSTAITTAGIVVAGGSFNVSGTQCNTDITVKSGSWRCVVGGGVATNNTAVDTATNTSKNQNGTFKTTIEGGTIVNLMGGNWAVNEKSQSSASNILTGGQAYVYIKDGNVSKLYFGGNNRSQATLHDGIVVYTGGTVGTILSCRTTGVCTLFYGENVSRNETNYPEAAFTLPAAPNSTTPIANVLVANVGGVNKSVACHNINILHVIPLATEDDNVVYLKHITSNNNESGATALGTEEDPIRYMHQAIAKLTYTGGTIKLMNDYTFAVRELNGMCQFVEPDHAPIVIDGQGYGIDGATGVKTHTEFPDETNGMKSGIPYGYNTYLMNGDVTFKNVDVAPTHDMNFAANFNAIVFDTDVVTTNVAWISGGIYLNTAYNSGSYVSNHYDAYQYFSDKDTSITINSGTNIKLSGYSRLLKQNGSPDPDYPGTANITINGGIVDTIYTAPTNSNNATGSNANVVVNGGTVKNLCIGGHNTVQGKNFGDVTVTYNGGDITNFNTNLFVNCEGNLTFVINKSYVDYEFYSKPKGPFSGTKAIVTTDLAEPGFEDAAFGIKYIADDNYGIRYVSSISADFFSEENVDKYNIVEFGVLVKLASNANSLNYFHGKESYLGISTEEGVENVDTETNIAKSVVYVKGEDIDRYMWAGEGDATVDFVAPLIGIDNLNADTEFTFCPYFVMVSSDGKITGKNYGQQKTVRLADIVDELRAGATDADACTGAQKTAVMIYNAINAAN